jgi:hypothetical protein
MSERETTETTAGGLLGKVVGKAKAAAGSLVGNEHARQKQRTAEETKAKRERLEVLDEQADALDQESDALTATDEAQRLRKAAGAAKAARKGSS